MDLSCAIWGSYLLLYLQNYLQKVYSEKPGLLLFVAAHHQPKRILRCWNYSFVLSTIVW